MAQLESCTSDFGASQDLKDLIQSASRQQQQSNYVMKAMLQQAFEAGKGAATSLAGADANFVLGQRDRLLRLPPHIQHIRDDLRSAPLDTDQMFPQLIQYQNISSEARGAAEQTPQSHQRDTSRHDRPPSAKRFGRVYGPGGIELPRPKSSRDGGGGYGPPQRNVHTTSRSSSRSKSGKRTRSDSPPDQDQGRGSVQERLGPPPVPHRNSLIGAAARRHKRKKRQH